MPLVRIDLPAGQPATFRTAVGDAVQQALHEALGVPLDERFQVIAEHGVGSLIIDPGYLGVARSPNAILIQATLNRGRDATKKQGFYRTAIAALQAKAGVKPADVVISLVEVGREDWSFGNGEAQLVQVEEQGGER